MTPALRVTLGWLGEESPGQDLPSARLRVANHQSSDRAATVTVFEGANQ